MSLTESQHETLNDLPTGLHINSGTPCECGADEYNTSKQRKYSDTMLYIHKCSQCSNRFTTWTEG